MHSTARDDEKRVALADPRAPCSPVNRRRYRQFAHIYPTKARGVAGITMRGLNTRVRKRQYHHTQVDRAMTKGQVSDHLLFDSEVTHAR